GERRPCACGCYGPYQLRPVRKRPDGRLCPIQEDRHHWWSGDGRPLGGSTRVDACPGGGTASAIADGPFEQARTRWRQEQGRQGRRPVQAVPLVGAEET